MEQIKIYNEHWKTKINSEFKDENVLKFLNDKNVLEYLQSYDIDYREVYFRLQIIIKNSNLSEKHLRCLQFKIINEIFTKSWKIKIFLGNVESLKEIMNSKKADVDADAKDEKNNPYNFTLLHLAALSGNKEMIFFLINAHKLDYRQKDKTPDSSSHSLPAGFTGRGGPVLAMTPGFYENCSILHYASIRCKPDTIKKLVELGLNPREKNYYGLTSLHYAIFGGNLEVLEFLLENEVFGFNTANLENAIQYAQEIKAEGATKWLQQYKIDLNNTTRLTHEEIISKAKAVIPYYTNDKHSKFLHLPIIIEWLELVVEKRNVRDVGSSPTMFDHHFHNSKQKQGLEMKQMNEKIKPLETQIDASTNQPINSILKTLSKINKKLKGECRKEALRLFSVNPCKSYKDLRSELQQKGLVAKPRCCIIA